MNEYAEIQSKEWCGGTSYFRKPELSCMVRYYAPFSDDGIKIEGVPQWVLDIAYWVAVFPRIGHIAYSKKSSGDFVHTTNML